MGGSFQAPKGPIAFLVFFVFVFVFLKQPRLIFGGTRETQNNNKPETEREREKQPPTDRLGGTEIKLTIDHPKRKWIEWM